MRMEHNRWKWLQVLNRSESGKDLLGCETTIGRWVTTQPLDELPAELLEWLQAAKVGDSQHFDLGGISGVKVFFVLAPFVEFALGDFGDSRTGYRERWTLAQEWMEQHLDRGVFKTQALRVTKIRIASVDARDRTAARITFNVGLTSDPGVIETFIDPALALALIKQRLVGTMLSDLSLFFFMDTDGVCFAVVVRD